MSGKKKTESEAPEPINNQIFVKYLSQTRRIDVFAVARTKIHKPKQKIVSRLSGLMRRKIIFTNFRSVAVHYAATVFPSDHAPSRYLLLLASGDEKNEIAVEAMKALYGTANVNERDNTDAKTLQLPEFPEIVNYIGKKMKVRMERPATEKFTVGTSLLPYNIAVFKEVNKILC